MSKRPTGERLGYTTRAKGHPIQVVMRRTGLSADVIRIWERRYGVVAPTRSDTGRRVYSDADIERLRLLARATLTGRTIGQVASLPNDALAELGARGDGAVDPLPPTDHLAPCLDAIIRFDGAAFDAELRRAIIALSAEAFLDTLVVPLWEHVAASERAGTLRAAHRHLTVAVLRRVLDRVAEAAGAPGGGAGSGAAPVLLVVTLPGFGHVSQEMGALLSAAAAAADGWRVTVAGPALVAEDVADLALALGARAVVVSLGAAAADRAAPRELRRLRALLPSAVAVVLEGEAAVARRPLARELGAHAVRDLPALRARLRAERAASRP